MNVAQKLIDILKKENVLLTGGAGVGKSYLVGEVVTELRKIGKQVVVLGSTGVSAVNVGGQTLHSFFAFGICNHLDELTRHDRYTKARLMEIKKVLTRCDLLVIDEISMVSADLLDMIYYRLRNAGFEGSVLFVGDFFQLPPVSKGKDDSLWGGFEYAFESSSWNAFEPVIVELTITKRTHDVQFFEHLGKIRRGILENDTIAYLEALRANVGVWDNDPTVLFGRNKEAEMLNIQKLAQIESEPIVLKAKEKVHEQSLHVNKIEGWKNALPIPVDLTLKVGAKVLFCTNKWGKYYNGETGIVRAIEGESVLVEKAGEWVKVERQEYTLHENVVMEGEVKEKPLVSLEQFPLKLAYAITIHKSQGMSIDSLVCNINNIFEKSQFYVAISRARYPKQLLLDYHYQRFFEHLTRCVQVSPKVGEFYRKSDILKIEEPKPDSLFDAF
ncbi:ATP-dependent RecD-like DNA helicase [Sulfurospirillum sp. hDNRA2]|uniref:ATP-dependent DNA helicase n=1 Tax=Sulfurospirillum sp. hDNRA2 TaxID=3237298 RepID=UPI0020B87D52|nr:AAA family ATPase [Sulfurospirillum sp. DNRA8]MCP3650950.1 AAA family ATPase [Sulfurospirillum sp. DNRA8]MCR1809796.1 AAA family ATPase [Sulfurospirillum sp. DNRA8]